MKDFLYGEETLTTGKAISIANHLLQGKLSENTKDRIRKSAINVEQMVQRGSPVYGINTGFGPLCTTSISAEETKILQTNILKSPAASSSCMQVISFLKFMESFKYFIYNFSVNFGLG